jgi:hypothetical protein
VDQAGHALFNRDERAVFIVLDDDTAHRIAFFVLAFGLGVLARGFK